MNSFRISFDWVDFAEGADESCLQETFANLTISIGSTNITRLIDKRARTIRDFAVVPLYPIAEWLVANWWSFLEEAEVPSRGISSSEYRSRHAIRFGREGYALPDVVFFPEGKYTRISWKPASATFQSVEFLEEGTDRVLSSELRQTFVDLIDSVVGRLEASKILDSWLQNEWQTIESISIDEREFCITAGWLGLDPFQISEIQAEEIVRVAAQLPATLREEVLKASPSEKLTPSVDWISAGLNALGSDSTIEGNWGALRNQIPEIKSNGAPWEDGYENARALREILGITDILQIDIDKLVGSPFTIIEAPKAPVESFDGLIGLRHSEICCFTGKHRPDSKRFICTRGLLSYLFDKATAPVFYSSAQTNWQQRSRAFAAEFLAPASLIEPRLSGDEVSSAEVEELAAVFDVSTYVIDHQIRNHKLGYVMR